MILKTVFVAPDTALWAGGGNGADTLLGVTEQGQIYKLNKNDRTWVYFGGTPEPVVKK